MLRPSLAAVAALLVGAACAANPKPGEPGYAYNLTGSYDVTFVVEGTPYTGTADLSTAPGGALSGTVALDDPATVLGSIDRGTVVGDSVHYNGSYSIQENGCSGTFEGHGTIAEGGAGANGPFRVEDDCDSGTLSGTFSFQR